MQQTLRYLQQRRESKIANTESQYRASGFKTHTTAANERASERTRSERAVEAARERACKGV
jgi:hypothetical protein